MGSDLRDYDEWHRQYDDPGSDPSWRLRRVSAVLVELHPGIAARARAAAAAAGLVGVEVRERDAGLSDAYAGAVPADIVLLVGILGNVSDEDLWRLVAVSRPLCAWGATLLWSRGLDGSDRNDQIRAAYAGAGFTELAYETSGEAAGAALGVVRYDRPSVPLEPGRRLFTFIR